MSSTKALMSGVVARTVDSAHDEQQDIDLSMDPGNKGFGSGLKADAAQQETVHDMLIIKISPSATIARNDLKWLSSPAFFMMVSVSAKTHYSQLSVGFLFAFSSHQSIHQLEYTGLGRLNHCLLHTSKLG